MCQAPSSTSAAAKGDSGKGCGSTALSSHRDRRRSSQEKCSDGKRHKSFEKQLQDLQWTARKQREAKSKGEKMWAGRQMAKTKEKFAKEWLVELEEKAKKSELKQEISEWRSTEARNNFEKARSLLREQEELEKTIKRRSKKEVEKIVKIEEQLQELRQRAAVEDSSAVQGAEVVAAVCERSELLKEEVGSTVGCEQSFQAQVLEKQVIEATLRAEKAEQKLQEAAALVKQHELETCRKDLQDRELREKLEEVKRRAQKAEAEAEGKVQQQIKSEAEWLEQRKAIECEATRMEEKLMKEAQSQAQQQIARQERQIVWYQQAHARLQRQMKEQHRAAVATAVKVAEVEQDAIRLELERATMAGEDARALCSEQQRFVKVCTVAEIRQAQKAAKIWEWAQEIEKWKRERSEDKEKIKSLEAKTKTECEQQQDNETSQQKQGHYAAADFRTAEPKTIAEGEMGPPGKHFYAMRAVYAPYLRHIYESLLLLNDPNSSSIDTM